MSYITDAYYEYIRRHTNDAKEDIQQFVDKFGQDIYELFIKSKDRLKNNNISTDIVWHTKHTDVDAMKEMLYALRSKVNTNSNPAKIAGKYNFIGNIAGYQVYQPLDVEASMALGVGSGWCITGRYGHARDLNFKPSYDDAKSHWNQYVSNGIKFFFYLQNGIAKYAVCVYPEAMTFTVQKDEDGKISIMEENPDDRYDYAILETNVEVYDQDDSLINLSFDENFTLLDLNILQKLQVSKLPNIEYTLKVSEITKTKYKYQDIMILTPSGRTLSKINTSAVIDEFVVPEYIEQISAYCFRDTNIKTIRVINPNTVLEPSAFSGANVENVYLPENITNLPYDCFGSCKKLKYLNVIHSLQHVDDKCFAFCQSLTFDDIPTWCHNISSIAGCNLRLKHLEVDNSVFEDKYGGTIMFNAIESLTLNYIDNKVYVEGCQNLKSIDGHTKNIGCYRCNKLTSINGQFNSLNIDNCPNVKTINTQNIDHFDISGNININDLHFDHLISLNVRKITKHLNIHINKVDTIDDFTLDELMNKAEDYYTIRQISKNDITFYTSDKKLIDFCKKFGIDYNNNAHDSIKTYIVRIK